MGITRTFGHFNRTASTLPSPDALSTTTISCEMLRRMVVKRAQAVLEIGPRVVADDHDGEISHWRPPRGPPSFRPQRVATNSATAQLVRRSITRSRTRSSKSRLFSADVMAGTIVEADVERSVTADLARDVRVEQHRGDAACERLERRMAEALVLRQQCKGSSATIQLRELSIVCVGSDGHLSRAGQVRQRAPADLRAGACDCRRRSPVARPDGVSQSV